MDAEIRIDHPDLAALGLTIATHDPETDRPVSHGIARARVWEGFLTRQIRALLRHPGFRSFYDLGANIGWHSLVAAADLRAQGVAGHVVAVEPAGVNQARLRHSVMLNRLEGRVHLVAGAVGDHNGQMRLEHDPGSASNHHLSGFSWPSETYSGGEDVAVYRLEDVVRDQGWPLPTLIKIDVQGHEMQALAGFGTMLDTVPDWIMAIEFVPDFWTLEALIALIRPEGVYQLDEQSLAVVPTSPDRLRAIGPLWPRKYYDLILTKGPQAAAALTALPDYSGAVQMRFLAGTEPETAGFGGMMEHGLRWAGPKAVCLLETLDMEGVDPVQADPVKVGQEIEITGQVERRFWEGMIVLTIAASNGAPAQRLVLKPKTPFTLRCRLGADPVRLNFTLHEKPGAPRRHPRYAYQLTHLRAALVP